LAGIHQHKLIDVGFFLPFLEDSGTVLLAYEFMFLLIENTSITCVLALQIEQDTYEFSVELIFFI